jgi:hypothetical protein
MIGAVFKHTELIMKNLNRRSFLGALLAAPMLAGATQASAQSGLSDANSSSALSLDLPVASLAVAPVMILSAGAVLTVTAVEASARGTVWVLERASDGVRASLELSAGAFAASMVVVGTVIVVTALSGGWLLSAAGEALCFVPNALGQSLFYSERITP